MKYNGQDVIEAGSDDYTTVTFDWSLIDVCNYKCSYCSAGFGDLAPVKKDSNFFKDTNKQQKWRQVIDRLRLSNIPAFEIGLLGGEPTLHPDIKLIVDELITMEKVIEIQLITNLTKPASFFEHFNTPEHSSKLIVNPSVHFEYIDVNKLTDRLLALELMEHIKLEVGVMLHDKIELWPKMQSVFDFLLDNNIHYYIQYIEPFHNYEPDYTNEMYENFERYVKHATDYPKYEFKTKTKQYDLDQTEINKAKLTRFKGWSCRQLAWRIDEAGNITRACGGEPLHLLGKNINTTMICPQTECKCDMWWDYKKIKNVTE